MFIPPQFHPLLCLPTHCLNFTLPAPILPLIHTTTVLCLPMDMKEEIHVSEYSKQPLTNERKHDNPQYVSGSHQDDCFQMH